MHDVPLTPMTNTTAEVALRVYSYDHRVLKAMFAFLFAVVGTSDPPANGFTAAALVMDKKLGKESSTAFMTNNLFSLVLLNAVGLPLFGVQVLHESPIPQHVITAARVFILILTEVHQNTVCAVAVNRVLETTYPSTYQRLMQPRWVAVYLVTLWLYSALLWLGVSGTLGPLSMAHGYILAVHAFVLPLFITGACYIFMYIEHVRTRKEQESAQAEQGKELVNNWRNPETRAIFIIFVSFVICNVPHFIMLLVQPRGSSLPGCTFLSILFGFQFSFDPIVYVIVNPEYRWACFNLLLRMRSSLRFRHSS